MQEEQATPKKKRVTRPAVAHLMMGIFVASSSVGVGLIFLPAGLITLGATAGLYGYLLGAN